MAIELKDILKWNAQMKLRELTKQPDKLTHGHRMCAGCGAPTVVKMVLMATRYPVVMANATGCLEVSTCISEFTAWRVPWIHSAFENAAATISGVETMYRALRKKGRLPEDVKFIAFGGDGGTYDIGLQSLSGAMERGHDMLYICYDNGAYMNTGIQRSSATPYGADTTTSPAGSRSSGKGQPRKDLTRIMAAHGIPFSAQASPSHWADLMSKVKKAHSIKGPKFMNILSPCNRGWRTETDNSIELSRMAVDSCFWPLYEIEDGRKVSVNYKPEPKIPVADFLRKQGRFKHLFAPENEAELARVQSDIDAQWARLLKESAEESS